MLAALFAVLASAAARPAPSANFAANLAYRSPSLTVSELEIPLHTVEKRLGKRYNDIWTGNVSFPWGVASGDPYDTSVILQTVAQKKDLGGVQNSPSSTPICLHWIVTKKDGFNASSWVQDGTVSTDVSLYYAAKVEATGLEPYTQYNYRFESCAGPALGTSIVGTFKTLPSETQTPPSIKMAVFSCSNLPYGFFNAYGAAANHSDTLDYWQHLGDYIYEYRNGDYGDGTATGRVPQPADRECTTLQDYRDRYASYRRDPDLVRLHQKLAVQAVWDDHEVADNTWAKGSADSNDTASGYVDGVSFSQRKANAVRAYYEWMPIRQVATDDKLRIWRNFKIGKLAELTMADTRVYDRSITDLYYNTDEIKKLANDTDRSLTGNSQKQWLFDTLKQSQDRGAVWRILAQQIVFNEVDYSLATAGAVNFNADSWSGYRAERREITSFIKDNGISNTVILSGDSHATWVFDLTQDGAAYNASTGVGAVGVEFAGSAVSSPSSYGSKLNETVYKRVAEALTSSNPHLQYAEGQLRGYYELTLTPTLLTADYYGFPDQGTRNSQVVKMATFNVIAGENRLRRPLNNGQTPQYGSLGKGAA